MKLSLITTTFNSANTLLDTIQSVRSQGINELEYIIVDGGSTDGTLELIQNNRDVISKFISEPDNGIYDAINKGIAIATGEVVGLIHSDDFFASNQVLGKVIEAFSDQDVDALYGDLQYVDRTDSTKVVRNWKSKPYSDGLFEQGWMPAHPTFYLRRQYFKQFGVYDTDFYTSADYELMLRMLRKHKLRSKYLPITMVKMRVGGQSNVSLKNRWIANQEDVRAWEKNGLQIKPLTRWLKPLSKISQFFQ